MAATPTKIRIPGTKEISPPEKTSTKRIKIKEATSYRISAARAAADRPEERDYKEDEVVEIEFLDGTRIWTSSERLCKEVIPPQHQKRGADAGIELPPGLAQDQATRGMVGKLLFKTLTFLGVDAAGVTAEILSKEWEKHTLGAEEGRGPGLYRCRTDGAFELASCKKSDLKPDRPILLFLHGTASSTRGSFGELWSADKIDLRRKLFEQYQGNVLALEHRTLSESPVENAIALINDLHEVLPENAKLHLVSHSRGGLVGELLCRVMTEAASDPFPAADVKWFKEKGDGRGDLGALSDLLKERRFQVERFVRVACPAWGTSLASNRLDIYLSVLFNLLNKVPLLGGNVGYDILTELIMLVAHERSNPKVLPGIESMIPGTPLVQLLNRSGCRVGGELRVIAGDIEIGGDVLSSLSALLTHPLYLGDNDLVVDTDAMYGGAARTGGAAFVMHQGPLVSHFNYFKNHDSATDLVRTLTRATSQEIDGFEKFDPFQKDQEKPPHKRGEGPQQPIVFLLPGFMGSHLAAGSVRIWLDAESIAAGLLDKLKLNSPGLPAVNPQEPVWLCYGGLTGHLVQSHEVIPFPYDWRLSLEQEAARLKGELERALARAEKAGEPVSIIAHSSGGLLARAVIALWPEIWERLVKHPKGRLIMLGTPNGGSYWAAQLLTGRDSLIKQLALLDMDHDLPTLLRIFSGFRGLLELLPTQLLDYAAWETLWAADPRREQWHLPDRAALEEAKRVRERIEKAELDHERVLYVAGVAPATPSDIADKDIDGKPAIVFKSTVRGDGRAPWSSSIPGELKKIWYLPVSHGDLVSDPDGFPAIAELLKDGSTERLEKSPPVSRGETADAPLPEENAPIYTGFQRLTRTAIGGGRRPKRDKIRHKVRVSVAHGSLAFTRKPVLAGHYCGDTIVSAEAYLDRIMDGRLRNRHSLDLYPGEEETAEVFLNPKGQPGGAIIIGLGEVGKLSPGKLMRAVSRGVRSYVITIAENCTVADDLPKRTGVAALLVGTNAGGVPVEDSVKAILRGVDHALQTLQEQRLDEKVLIDELEFVELYEDRAIHAVHALGRASVEAEIERRFLIDPALRLNALSGGLRRASFVEEDPWWQRLEIVENSAGNLSFNVLTDRARSEVYLQQSQRALADHFIADIKKTDSITSHDVAVTLFEMLIPNEIKEYAPDRRDVVLVLNKEAARYPWEMMTPRSRRDGDRDHKPLAVQAGMIRQLQVKQFREQVVMARGHHALIIGNPKTSRYVDLPGAEDEAREVKKLLDAEGFTVEPLIGGDATGNAVIRGLHAHDYRIIHLAGHGVFEHHEDCAVPCDCCGAGNIVTKISGMVIGDNEYLTPAQLAQMRAVPELVFVNCCHLGNVEGEDKPNYSPKLAANIATELIRMGVKAVVAAGWEVDDSAARLFATTFYKQMLAGVSFGDAVLTARSTIYDASPGVNTWGAYQCYGDHAFCLSGTDGKPVVSPRTYRFAAPIEIVTRLDNVSEEAGTADEKHLGELKAEVKEIEERIPNEWRKSGAILAALGRAYGELQDFEKAISLYQEALKDEKSACAVKVIEQLANLQARLAAQMVTDPQPAREEGEAAGTQAKRLQRAMEEINKSEQWLEKLNALIGETSERLCLRGATAKRKAMVETTKEGKRRALEEMAEHYRQGWEKAGRTKCYPHTNQLTAKVLISLLDGHKVEEDILREIRRQAQEAAKRDCALDFWASVESADYQLLLYIADPGSYGAFNSIADEYERIKKCLGSPLQLSSIMEHLSFLANILDAAPDEVKERFGSSLHDIRSQIAA